MWLSKLKIAVVEKDVEKLRKLLESVPKLQEERELQEALYLLEEATLQIQKARDETLVSMRQIRKNVDFLRSTETSSFKSLDIRL